MHLNKRRCYLKLSLLQGFCYHKKYFVGLNEVYLALATIALLVGKIFLRLSLGKKMVMPGASIFLAIRAKIGQAIV